MKTTLLLTALSILVMNKPSFADEPEKVLSSNIRQHLTVPAAMKKSKETARIDFRINESGLAEIIMIHTDDAAVKKDVERQFRSMKHDKESFVPGKVYTIKVTFKVI